MDKTIIVRLEKFFTEGEKLDPFLPDYGKWEGQVVAFLRAAVSQEEGDKFAELSRAQGPRGAHGRQLGHLDGLLIRARMEPRAAQVTASPRVVSLKELARRILNLLADLGNFPGDSQQGRYSLDGSELANAIATQPDHPNVDPARINDAVALLENDGFVEVERYLGTSPYAFSSVELTAIGRLEYENSSGQIATSSTPANGTRRPIAISGKNRVFVGHGRSEAWRVLKDFLKDRLNLEWDEFNREATAGIHTIDRLKTMLSDSCFAFLVMTAEDERSDGAKTARANVIHEVGLFQGRLGFERAIVLLEHGCEEFSNIAGLSQIRFSKDNIQAVFEDIRRVLEREQIIERR